jgi:hypothetical protein
MPVTLKKEKPATEIVQMIVSDYFFPLKKYFKPC